MQNIQGFMLINIYALLLILATSIIFFSKKRLKQVEDELYKKFLIANIFISISGLFLGLIVSPILPYDEMIISIFNKLYLISLMFWIYILTFYTTYISLKNNSNVKKYNKIFDIISIISVILILILPIKVSITSRGGAVSTGPAILFTYTMFGIGFIIQLCALISNYKHLKNKKYIPLYLLILFGSIILIVQIINPALNYIINPALIFIAFIMYHTIENPDIKTIEEIHRAKEISDNANEEKTMFLYNMTSNIRSIAKDINTSADNILDETDNKKVNMEVINDSARDIKGNAAKFTTMTNEVFDISNIDSAGIKVYNSKYNIKILLKEINQRYKNKANAKDLKFITNIASDLPEYLYGDSVSLKKVLTILLDNSIKYTEKGYIEFDVNTIIKNNIVRLIITIEDSGKGMTAEELNKSFIKTNQKDEKDNISNNLYNVKRLITLMNGAIIPNSIYNNGTTMKIVLDQRYKERQDNLDKYEDIIDKKRVLLIDDNENSEKLFKKILNNTNIEIVRVKLGKEGLDKIRNKEKYDLILLDEEMSPLDGHEVMRKLKQIVGFNTKVILLTKTNKYDYDDEYKEEGFIDYLIKSSKKELIKNKINKYLK